MVDQHAYAARAQQISRNQPLRVVRKNLREPSQLLNPGEQMLRARSKQMVGIVADEIEADSDDARMREPLQLGVRNVGINHSDGLEPARAGPHRLKKYGIVRAISTELNQHGMRHTVLVEQPAEFLSRSGFLGLGLVAHLAAEGKAGRIDEMGVAVDNSLVHKLTSRASIADNAVRSAYRQITETPPGSSGRRL